MTGSLEPADTSDRLRGVALLLNVLLGVFGAHRFYAGRPLSGVLMLGTLGGGGIWWLYDMIVIASGGFRDGEDRRIWRWWETSSAALPAATHRQLELVLDELDVLRTEMGDLNERVDFVERMLTKARDRGALPAGD